MHVQPAGRCSRHVVPRHCIMMSNSLQRPRTFSGGRSLAAGVWCVGRAAGAGVAGAGVAGAASDGDAACELSMELLPMREGRRGAVLGVTLPPGRWRGQTRPWGPVQEKTDQTSAYDCGN